MAEFTHIRVSNDTKRRMRQLKAQGQSFDGLIRELIKGEGALEEGCHFCEAIDVIIPEVGIALGMGGGDYAFCEKCLESMTALEFWKRFFKDEGYTWPPKLKKANNKRAAGPKRNGNQV